MKELCFLINWRKKKELANIIYMNNIVYVTISVKIH